MEYFDLDFLLDFLSNSEQYSERIRGLRANMIDRAAPKPYPPNNQLRREHKQTIGREMREKRNREIRAYKNQMIFDLFPIMTDILSETIEQDLQRKMDEMVGIQDYMEEVRNGN